MIKPKVITSQGGNSIYFSSRGTFQIIITHTRNKQTADTKSLLSVLADRDPWFLLSRVTVMPFKVK